MQMKGCARAALGLEHRGAVFVHNSAMTVFTLSSAGMAAGMRSTMTWTVAS